MVFLCFFQILEFFSYFSCIEAIFLISFLFQCLTSLKLALAEALIDFLGRKCSHRAFLPHGSFSSVSIRALQCTLRPTCKLLRPIFRITPRGYFGAKGPQNLPFFP